MHLVLEIVCVITLMTVLTLSSNILTRSNNPSTIKHFNRINAVIAVTFGGTGLLAVHPGSNSMPRVSVSSQAALTSTAREDDYCIHNGR